MKKSFYVFMFFLFINMVNSYKVVADDIHFNDSFHFINYDNYLSIYKDNVYIDNISDAIFLDANDEFMLFNKDEKLWRYNLNEKTSLYILDKVYNAMFFDDLIIYESDKSNEYICKNIIGNLEDRNCYKLYIYDMKTNNSNLIYTNGGDNYLNDVEGNNIVYTSIHTRDKVCSSICSFINVYNYANMENKVINRYDELILDMSGNAFIDNNIVYFESVPNTYDCNNTQIFSFNLSLNYISIITIDDNICFNENSRIINAENGYLLFKSKYKNYYNHNEINYIYSYYDNKYSQIDNNYIYSNNIKIVNNELCVYDSENINFLLIDTQKPFFNTSIKYMALLEREDKLINLFEYDDNLTSRENIKIEFLTDIDVIGEYFVSVKICDNFLNCLINDVLVEVIDIDVSPPKIYCQDSIVIYKNETIDIDKYGYAIDNVDGKIKLNILGDISYEIKGTYLVLLESKDSSGNISYKEIEVIVYDKLNLISVYLIFVILTIISIIIIYIFRFKKSNRF